MMTLRYVGPHDAVEIRVSPPEQYLDEWVTVVRGATVDVPDEVAGALPWNDDLGAGLLAQPSNWEPVYTPSDDSPAVPEEGEQP